MLVSYEAFRLRVIANLKVRSANYVNTDCDIRTIIATVYDELQNEILFSVYKQEHILVKDQKDITLVNDNHSEESGLPVSEMYRDVLDIVDENDVSILDLLHETSYSVWRWNNYSQCMGNSVSLSDGRPIYFLRKRVHSIETLPPEYYAKILTAMLEGVMYYVESAIPSQPDTAVANWSYKRYYNAREALKNEMSQKVFAHEKEKKWL